VRTTVFFMVSLWSLVLMGRAQTGLEKREVLSANGKFRLVIEADSAIVPKEGEAPEAIASMLEVRKDGREAKWRRKMEDALFLEERRTFVSDRGEFFIAASLGERPKVYTEKSAVELPIADSANTFHCIYALDTWGTNEIFRVWEGKDDGWLAFELPEPRPVKPSGVQIAAWNEKTRAKILIKKANFERAALEDRLFEKSPRLARAAKLLPTKEVETLEDIDCVFLAYRNNPDDRKWFEGMLKQRDFFPQAHRQSFVTIQSDESANYFFEEIDYQRWGADSVLAIFDRKRKFDPASGLPGGALYLLGGVAGQVQLSTPIRANAGCIHIFLIPAGAENREWINLSETEKLHCDLPAPKREWTDLKEQIEFNFGSVLPGKYFAKTVWDKRPPRGDQAKAGPGDYESGLIGPITVTAGTITSNVVINCTNRVSGGEAYYAADDLARRKLR
jgi:hypothetical protein